MSKPEQPSEARSPRATRSWLERAKAQSQLEFDLDFYSRVLERSPNYVDVLRCQGELLSHAGEHARALKVDQQLVGLRPDDCIVRYNLACSLAMSDRPAEALVELRRALEAGYDDFEYLECDGDLDSLRQMPGYQELMRQFGIEQ